VTLIECDDRDSWIGLFIDEFLAAAKRARAARRSVLRLCLAGGSTPEPIYRAMARAIARDSAASPDVAMPIDIWPGDERVVPPGDPARNGDMIAAAFSDASSSVRVRQWPTGAFETGRELPEGELEAAARRDAAVYAARLAESAGSAPAFDLAILGLGSDGHTASLFPGDAALAEKSALATIARAPSPPLLRMTLAYAALASVRRTLFAVAGAEKAAVVRALAAEDPALPASAAGGADRAIVYLMQRAD
jgi:6-phosphogluconolactonase